MTHHTYTHNAPAGHDDDEADRLGYVAFAAARRATMPHAVLSDPVLRRAWAHLAADEVHRYIEAALAVKREVLATPAGALGAPRGAESNGERRGGEDRAMTYIIGAIEKETERQHKKWGAQNHDDGYWLGIVTEELGEAAKAYIEGQDPGDLIGELVQTAASIVSWIDCINRRAYAPQGAESTRERQG